MTPFGTDILRLLRHRSFRQCDLARAIGAHPTYLSALLHGRKGRPSRKQITTIAQALNLNSREFASLEAAAEASFKSLDLPADANLEERRMAVRLVSVMGCLLPDQIQAINNILNLTPHSPKWPGRPAPPTDMIGGDLPPQPSNGGI